MARVANIIVFVLTIIVFLSTRVSPEKFWVAGFLALSIPVFLFLNVVLLIFYLIRNKIWFLFPLIALLFGYKYVLSSFSINLGQESEADAFSVLNYNVRVFNSYAYLQNVNDTGKSMIRWISDSNADVKCLQEFYNEDSSNVYDTFTKLRKGSQYHSYIQPSLINSKGAQFGLAIFSKFPIVACGEVHLKDDRQQHAIYVDLMIQQDTIRVYNVHLQSMSIDENKIGNIDGDMDRVRENYLTIARKLKHGFINRARQIDNLLTHIKQSPHRVIVCGDLNDIPYSYTYATLKKYLYNAFEEAGNGLGFSYNGKLFFLRIDNQFYSDGLEAKDFQTHREIPYSDHYPVKAFYTIEEKN